MVSDFHFYFEFPAVPFYWSSGKLHVSLISQCDKSFHHLALTSHGHSSHIKNKMADFCDERERQTHLSISCMCMSNFFILFFLSNFFFFKCFDPFFLFHLFIFLSFSLVTRETSFVIIRELLPPVSGRKKKLKENELNITNFTQ